MREAGSHDCGFPERAESGGRGLFWSSDQRPVPWEHQSLFQRQWLAPQQVHELNGVERRPGELANAGAQQSDSPIRGRSRPRRLQLAASAATRCPLIRFVQQ